MNEQHPNVAVGATALAGLIGLMALLFLFGYFPKWAERVYEVQVRLPSAYGLGTDARVYLSGIDIGRVGNIKLDEEGKGVVVSCRIDERYRLPEGVRVELSSSVLGGGATLQFVVDRTEQDEAVTQYLPTDGSAVVYGESASPVGVFAKELRGALAQPLERFDRMADSLEQLTREWRDVGRNLNRLTEARTIDDVDDSDMVGNLSTVIARADERLAEMKQVLEGINRYVNDEQLYQDVRGTIAQGRKVAENFSKSVETLEQRYVALADDMSEAIGTLNEVLDRVNRGDGTVGKLMVDPELYDNLNDAAERLNVALEELQLLFEKMKDEGLKFKL